MATPSMAMIQVSKTGTVDVGAMLRLCGDSFIACHTYSDGAPILAIDDGPARITVTVPDREYVTEADLNTAHRLADAVDRYVTELKIRLRKQDAARSQAA
jgi:hypothetical protein